MILEIRNNKLNLDSDHTEGTVLLSKHHKDK